MKKTLIAAAVATVCAAPMAAQAEAEVSAGFVAGFQNDNDDAAGLENEEGTTNIVLDTAEIGASASEDLGNGLTAEAGVLLDAVPDDGVVRDNAWGALSGDFGSVLLGWGVDSAFYLHTTAVTDVGEVLGSSLAYYQASAAAEEAGVANDAFFSDDTASQAVQYGYDGGAFSLTLEAVMDDSGDDTGADGSNEAIDRLGMGASFDAGPVMIGVGHESASRAGDDAAEPSKTGFSASGGFGNFDLGASYVMFDSDEDDAGDPTALDLSASTDLGGGLGVLGGVGIFDSDADDDTGSMTGFHVQVSQELSSRTLAFAQVQTQSVDGGDGDDDSDPRSLFVGMSHAF